jgi:putative membrane protein insertion efficiency factor
MSKVLLRSIRYYQKHISPLKPGCCRFVPTCSEYAAIAVERYGAAAGSVMAMKRLLRCHPLCKGGYDPVPELPDAVIRRDVNQ